MNNITKNGENLLCNIGEILENKIKIKEEIYYNYIELYKNYITLSIDYIDKIKIMLAKYKNIIDLNQNEDIIFSFGIEILSLLNEIFEEYISTLKLSLYLEPNDILNDIRDNINNIILSEKEYNKEIKELNNLRNKYNESLRNVENYLINFFINDKNNEEEIPNNNELNNLINVAKQNEKIYCNKINNINALKLDLKPSIQNNLKVINLKAKKKSQILIQNLKVFSSLIKNKYEREKVTFDKKHIKIESLKDSFLIEEKLVGTKFMNELVFIPYECEFLKNDFQNKNSYSQKQYNSIVSYLKKHFKFICSTYDENEEEKNYLNKYVNLILNNDIIEENEFQDLLNKLENRKYRFVLLSILNKKRVTGCFKLKLNSFKQLGKIIQLILNKTENDNDIECFRYIIIMCQTYYFLNSKNNEKIYLLKYIENHKIFKSKEFWILYITHILNEELEKSSSTIAVDRENEIDKNKRINNIIFTTLLSMTQNMSELYLDCQEIANVIFYFLNKYNLNKEDINEISFIIDSCKKEYIPFDENELKE